MEQWIIDAFDLLNERHEQELAQVEAERDKLYARCVGLEQELQTYELALLSK